LFSADPDTTEQRQPWDLREAAHRSGMKTSSLTECAGLS
jgi:hypothetical protein